MRRGAALLMLLPLAYAARAQAITVQTCAAIPPGGVAMTGGSPPPYDTVIDVERDPAAAEEARLYLVVGDGDNGNEGQASFTGSGATVAFMAGGDVEKSGDDNLTYLRRVLPADALGRGANPLRFTKTGSSTGYVLYRACVQLTYSNTSVGVVAGGPADAPAETFCPDELAAGPRALGGNDGVELTVPLTVAMDRAPSATGSVTAHVVMYDLDSFAGGVSEGAVELADGLLELSVAPQNENDDRFSLLDAPMPGVALERGVMPAAAIRREGFTGYELHGFCVTVDGLLVDGVDAGVADAGVPIVDAGGGGEDAGLGPVDAGVVEPDAGNAPTDAGPVVITPDAAVTTPDAAPRVDAAVAFDAGGVVVPPDAGRGVDAFVPPLPDAAVGGDAADESFDDEFEEDRYSDEDAIAVGSCASQRVTTSRMPWAWLVVLVLGRPRRTR